MLLLQFSGSFLLRLAERRSSGCCSRNRRAAYGRFWAGQAPGRTVRTTRHVAAQGMCSAVPEALLSRHGGVRPLPLRLA